MASGEGGESSVGVVGDVIEVVGHAVGKAARTGEILEVLGEASHPHYRVRWSDETETVFYPSSDAVVRPKPDSE